MAIHACSEPGCSRTFSKPSRLRDHMYTHTGERHYICHVAECGKSFTRNQHLKRHEQVSHKIDTNEENFEEKNVVCTEPGCSEVFTNSTNLKKHIKRKHTKQYQCHVEGCGERFYKKTQLRRHSFTHTIGDIRCQVEGCGRIFDQHSHLSRHMKQHNGYPCKEPNCDLIFYKFSHLRKHMVVQHKSTYICKECGKEFNERSQLRAHIKTHDIGDTLFHCPHDGCLRSYKQKRNLTSHIRATHREKKFKCPLADCMREFCHQVSLKHHMKLHDPEHSTKPKIPKKQSIKQASLDNMKKFLGSGEGYTFTDIPPPESDVTRLTHSHWDENQQLVVLSHEQETGKQGSYLSSSTVVRTLPKFIANPNNHLAPQRYLNKMNNGLNDDAERHKSGVDAVIDKCANLTTGQALKPSRNMPNEKARSSISDLVNRCIGRKSEHPKICQMDSEKNSLISYPTSLSTTCPMSSTSDCDSLGTTLHPTDGKFTRTKTKEDCRHSSQTVSTNISARCSYEADNYHNNMLTDSTSQMPNKSLSDLNDNCLSQDGGAHSILSKSSSCDGLWQNLHNVIDLGLTVKTSV